MNKLQRVRGLQLPPELFGDVSGKLVAAWRARAAKEYPSDLRAAAGPVRYTLLSTLCHVRETEITDSLVELFIQLVQKINTRAEKKVEGEFNKELKRVRGKEGILLRLAEAAVAEPGGTVRKVIYPVAGESTLKALAAEAAANEARYRARVRTVLRSSYSNHWRRMLSPLLNALELKCNNTAYRPVMDAIDLLKRYLDQPIAKEGAFFDEAEKIPLAGVVREEWRKAVVDERGRVERIPYELCVLVALRDALRRREIWVPGANRWQNPEDDLPPDFEDNRDVHYDAIRQPQDPEKFIEALEKRLREALTRFDTALELGTTGGVDIVKKHGEPWIKVSPLGKQEEPTSLVALKAEIERRWGTIDLIDILKEAEFATGFTGEFTSVATREAVPKAVLRRRIAAGAVRAGDEHGHQAGRGHRQARRERGRPAPGTAPVRQPDQPARGAGAAGQRHLRRPRCRVVGRGHRLRERLQEVRLLELELHDRVAPAVPRARGDDLLARREEVAVRLQPAQILLGLRSRRDDRGRAAALHGRGDRPAVHRHARRVHRRVRLRPHARLQPPPQAEERRLSAPVPAAWAVRTRSGRTWRRCCRPRRSTGT